ncbi:MAG: CCDC90 family protein [Caulobacter sp.]|nr:CCDC90 family protein [Caulobacter sp.]
MTPYTFDTLSASKQLREAGMAEGVAEAVVAVFQHATSGVDLSELATKADLDGLRLTMATKADLDGLRLTMATKADLDALHLATKADMEALRMATKADMEALRLATKADLEQCATKADLERFVTKTDLHGLRADFSEKLRQHTLAMLGGMGVLLGIFTVLGKLIA